MIDPVYDKLADILDSLPNSFPRTESNVEIQLLQKVFSLQEAEVASQLTGDYQPIDVLAERTGISARKLQKELFSMAKKWMVMMKKENRMMSFRIAPFIVGIYEGHLERMDHEFSHLFENYMLDAGKDIMKYNPSVHRAIPALSLAKHEWILPYDDVLAIVDKANNYRVRDCICRVQQGLIGKGCDSPRHNCLMLSPYDGPPKPGDLSKDEVIAILKEAEKTGLVHCVSNHQEELTYICNCCGCCCSVLRGINEYGLENSIAHANYFAVIDPNECTGCGICIDRCQVNAISELDGISVVDVKKCIGCGLCVTGCPDKVAKLIRKPENEIVNPPIALEDWENQRRSNRG